MKTKYLCHVHSLLSAPAVVRRRWDESTLGGRLASLAYSLAHAAAGPAPPYANRRLMVRLMWSPRIGIRHFTSILRTLLAEAAVLGRTAVVPDFNFDKTHNFGRAAGASIHEYYDLPASYVVMPDGSKITPACIDMRDFLKKFMVFHPFYPPRMRAVSPKENARRLLIMRHLAQAPATLWHNNPGGPFAAFDRGLRQVHMQIKAPLEKAGQKIAADLGNYCYMHWRKPWDHERRPDKMQMEGFPQNAHILEHFMSGEKLLRQLPKVLPPGSKLYIASNVWENDEPYFGALRDAYEVFRYRDFPALRALADGTAPDTAKLLLIEQVIERGAFKKFTFHPTAAPAIDEMRRILALPPVGVLPPPPPILWRGDFAAMAA